LREWKPGIATGIVVAQLAAPHVRGSVMTGVFALLCLTFSVRFAFPNRFCPVLEQPPANFRSIAGTEIGLCSCLAGVGELYRREADAAEERRQPQPTQTVWQPGSIQWLAEQKKRK
jgi:hypothetical protein